MQTWIEEELQTSDFRDQRLDRRYAVLMDELSQRPSVSIPNACGGWAETLAADGDPGDSSDACEVAWPPAAGPSLRGPTTQYSVLSTQYSARWARQDLAHPTSILAGVLQPSQVGFDLVQFLLDSILPEDFVICGL